MGPRFRQNNYRGSQRVRVRTVAAVIALPSIPPGWPTFSYVKQLLPEGIKGQQPAASRSTSQCGFEECFPLKLELDGERERSTITRSSHHRTGCLFAGLRTAQKFGLVPTPQIRE